MEKEEILNLKIKREWTSEEKWMLALDTFKYISNNTSELAVLTAISEMFKIISEKK
jgi:hypothetical protein